MCTSTGASAINVMLWDMDLRKVCGAASVCCLLSVNVNSGFTFTFVMLGKCSWHVYQTRFETQEFSLKGYSRSFK